MASPLTILEGSTFCICDEHGDVAGPTGGLVMVKESTWTPPKPSTVVSKKVKAVVVKK